MEVYFDNSATTRCFDEVKDIVCKTMTEDFGNPSAMHKKGVEAENYVRRSAQTLAKLLKVNEKEILFTSGGTESDNLAIIGGVEANKRMGNHIITTAVEHAAVAQPFAYLKEQGYEVTILPVDHQGVVKLDALEAALRPDTILVSVMYVNNEVGAVMPVDEIGKLVHEKSPKALFHVDAIQAFGKYRIYPKKLGIDLLSVSSHKIHGPKGVGFLYIDEKVRVQPQILGGGQQNGMRSGTDNVPGIAGLGVAAEMVYTDLDKKIQHLYDLKQRLAEGLKELGDVTINGMPLNEGAPHIMSVTFHGVRSEVLLHTLEEFGVYISAGSACSSHKRKPSATLSAMGMSNAQIENTVRISFSEENTFEEVDYWDEVVEIMEWSKTHVTSTLHICWAAQAGLYYHYGIKKHILNKKISGVYEHHPLHNKLPIIRGFDDKFYVPHSRNTGVDGEAIRKNKELTIVAESDETGPYIILNSTGSQVFVTGHPEYDPDTLDKEYHRDLAKGGDCVMPKNYYKNDDVNDEILVKWRSHAYLLFSNWLNYYVYQNTPYNLDDLLKMKTTNK